MNTFNDPKDSWVITPEDRSKYDTQFYSLNPAAGFLSGEQAKFFFLKSGLSNQILGMIWNLSDVNVDGKMDKNEFCIAMHLIKRCLKGLDLPVTLPSSLLSSLQFTSPGLSLQNQLSNSQVASSSSLPLSNLPPYNTMPYHSHHNNQAPKHNAYSLSRGATQCNEWLITPAQKLKFKALFDNSDTIHKGYLTGLEAKGVLSQSGLTHSVLAKIWCLADHDADGNLSLDEFCVAMYLIEQAKTGVVLPSQLPADLVPPSQRKLRRVSEVAASAVNAVAATAAAAAANVASGNNRGTSSSRTLTPSLECSKHAGISTDDVTELEHSKIVTFEDKRKENFEQGQAELEKRRAMLRDLQMKESEERLAAERVEHEQREKQRLDQEMRRQEEFERQLERQRKVEMEREEERRRLLQQKEAARQELNRQRQAEWQKQRQEQLVTERSKFQAAVDQLKQQTGQQRLKLESLRERKRDTGMKVDETRRGLGEMSSIIDSIKLLSLSKSTEIDVISSELEEVEMKMVAVEQETLRFRKQMETSSHQSNMDDTWRELKREEERREEGMVERRKKLEIMGESCGKKEEVIKRLEEELKVKGQGGQAVLGHGAKTDNLFSNFDSSPPAKTPWQGPHHTTKWEHLTTAASTSLKEDAWANVSANQDDKAGVWTSSASDQKSSWTADFNSSFDHHPPTSDDTLKAADRRGVRRFKALYNFEARTHDELSLLEADVVTVDERAQASAEPGWMIGSKGAQTGCFPEAYVALLDESPADVSTTAPAAAAEVKDPDKNVFSTLSRAFEEAFSAKKSPSKEATTTHDTSSLQAFQALNDAFTTAFGAVNVTSTTALDQSANFNHDFSTLNFDKSNFESSHFDASNFDSSNFEPSSFEPSTTPFDATSPHDHTTSSHDHTISPHDHTTSPLQVPTSSMKAPAPCKSLPSSIDSAIKDILEKSRRTPVSPIPFATSTLLKCHSPSPLTTSSKSASAIATNNTAFTTTTTTVTTNHNNYDTTTTNLNYDTTTTNYDTTTTNYDTTTTNYDTTTTNYDTKTTDVTSILSTKTFTTNTDANETLADHTEADTKDTVPEAASKTAAAAGATAITAATTPLAIPQLLGSAVKVQAVYAWQAKKPNHLSFAKGDVITKLCEQDTWCFGEFKGERGWFPKSYVKVIGTSDSPFPDLPPEVKPDSFEGGRNGHHLSKVTPPILSTNQSASSSDHQSILNDRDAASNKDPFEEFIVVAMFSYDSQVPGDLTFNKGEVFVAQATDADWWTGSHDDGRTGIFPSSYVRKVETMVSGKLSETKPEIAMAIAEYEGTGPEQLSVKVDQLIHVRKKSKSGWWEGEIQVKGQRRRVGWFPANYVKMLGADDAKPPHTTSSTSFTTSSTPLTTSSTPLTTSSTPLTTKPEAATQGCSDVVALYTYVGQTEGDLSFVEGDRIRVRQRCSDDWWEGELNGRVGIFPANYVAMVTEVGDVTR